MKVRSRHWLLRCLLPALCLLWLTGCQTLPPLEDRVPSTALPAVTNGPLAQAIAPHIAEHPQQTGIFALTDPREAFGARVVLAREARQSIDVQYYIWRKDVTGTVLMAELLKAADRGVRVRLLLDDINTSGLDDELALLDAHKNVEVRLFNPFLTRRARWLGYVTDFSRLNRRMHNKSFTVDNLATVVGGRNVGDEYFGAGESVMFTDLDVIGVGPVVDEVSHQFDLYWASASSYPVRGFLTPPAPERAQALRDEMMAKEATPQAQGYFKGVRDSPMARAVDTGNLGGAMEWTTARMLSDDPAKGLGQAPSGSRLIDRLKHAIGDPKRKLDLVSPYFVPTETGTNTFVQMAQQGVAIRVLTNSLEATDVTPVHAGYAKRRKDLLRGGVTLYELKRSAMTETETEPVSRKSGRSEKSDTSDGVGGSGGSGSSGASLHAKTFAVDDSRVYVGSFNFDPRSIDLNTEMGFLIDSPALAQRMSTFFDKQVPVNAYRPELTDDGKLQWQERTADTVRVYEDEPGASWWQRVQILLLSPLPIESLL